MVHVAYDKDTQKILAFIVTNDEINNEEVFANFDNYDVVKTDIQPPFSQYKKYTVIFDKEGKVVGYEIKENENNE